MIKKFYEEEQLPLYIPQEKNSSKNNSNVQSNGTKKYNIYYSKMEIPDKKKSIKIKSRNKLIKSIYNFIDTLFNNKNQKIVLFFFILLLVSFAEYYIDTYIDIFAVKFGLFILFSIPFLIIFLDNESFFQLNSYFEFNFLLLTKFIVLFNKKMNFLEIILLSICANLFQSIYIKKIHMKQYFLTLDGFIDKRNYKLYIFESEIFFIIFGLSINIFILGYLLKKDKFYFYLFDDILIGLGENYKNDYFFLFEYMFLKKFIKYYIIYIFKYDYKNKSKQRSKIIYITFIIFIFVQFIYANILYSSFSDKILNILFILLLIFIYENIGTLLYPNLILLSISIILVNKYIESHFDTEIIILIKDNIKYINISFLLSLAFIISIFILEKRQITSFYIKIYQRIFLIKIIFDIWLMIKYIYSLYKYNSINYFDIFIKTYKLFFSFFIFNYVIVLFFVLMKLYIYINPNDIDWSFQEIIVFMNNKKLKKEVYYGGEANYFEIRLYKKCKKLANFFKEDISKSNKKMKSFQKILYSIIIFNFIFLAIIINDCMKYFLVFFILIQFCSDFINDIIFIILNKFALVIYFRKGKEEQNRFKRYKEDYMIQKYNKKLMKQKAMTYIMSIKKEKLKFIYIIAFFFIYLFLKKTISKFYIFLYENVISFFQYKVLGRLEPLGNIAYQFLIMNFREEINNENILKENLFLFLFLLPNSLAIIYSHYNCIKLNFFFHNYMLTCLLPYFFKLDFIITFLGFINIFLMINLFLADNATYKAYYCWFFLFGIQSMDFKF